MEEEIRSQCERYRQEIKEIGIKVRLLMKHSDFREGAVVKQVSDLGEMRANIMLAYRHLEDARMRIGKVMQAEDGGTSIYDK